MIWKDKLLFRSAGVKKIAQVVLVNYRHRINRVFQKWKHFCDEQNFQIRMQGLCVELGFKKFKSSLFMAWRSQTQVMKTARYNRLLRTFKNIKVHWQRRL